MAALVWATAAIPAPAGAQGAPAAPPGPPPGPLTGTAGVGLAMTGGNTETSTLSISYDITYDPKTKNVVKSDALYLRSKNGEELTVDRFNLNARDEYHFAMRAYVYGQLQYLRDSFKEIDYLIAPTAGVGYKLVDQPKVSLAVDGGVGGVWEKNPGAEVNSSGALTSSEHFTWKLSDTSGLTQQVTGLWKTSDLGDALYTAGVGLIAGLTAKSQAKIEVADTYKTRPPTATTERNDVALVFSVGYKF